MLVGDGVRAPPDEGDFACISAGCGGSSGSDIPPAASRTAIASESQLLATLNGALETLLEALVCRFGVCVFGKDGAPPPLSCIGDDISISLSSNDESSLTILSLEFVECVRLKPLDTTVLDCFLDLVVDRCNITLPDAGDRPDIVAIVIVNYWSCESLALTSRWLSCLLQRRQPFWLETLVTVAIL